MTQPWQPAAEERGLGAGSWTRDRLVQQSLKVSKILCFVTMLFPLLTAAGWFFDIPILTQGHSALPAMQPNTAVGLFLAALAVLATREGAAGYRRTFLALLPAAAMIIMGVLTLGEYAFGWDVGIDGILLHNSAKPDQPFLGRPSPQTLVNFVLLGAAIVCFKLDRQLRLGSIAAIVTAANAIEAATGYIFGTGRFAIFFGLPIHTPAIGMAVHTSASFILLAIALFCARPNDGIMTLITSDTHAGRLTRRILVAVIAAPPVIGALTKVGVVAGWYDVGVQVSLFATVMVVLILRTTWQAARQADHHELLARAAGEALQNANNKLREAIDERESFAALVENSPDFIGIADPNGKPVYANPAARRMIGLAPDFPIGDTAVTDYYPPDLRAFASNVILKSMFEHGHWEGETFFRHWQTGKAIPVSDTHFMIRSPGTGQVLGHGTITRDISEAKRAREEIEEANRRLQEANEQITHLYKKTSELDDLKTRFFANVSHEFRTPLSLILGPIEKHLGSTPGLSADLRRDLEVVERSARTILRHIDDLLDVARLDAGRLKPQYSETDAAKLVRFLAEQFSALAEEKHIAFAVEAPAALRVQTDSDKLQRMLLNLLSNAFKFTPDGGRIRISLREIAGRFIVEVGDSGPGIPEDKRLEVFERFHQLEKGATRRGGTGLGLSIVKDFVALLRGSISVADAPEGGALLVLDLPSVAPPGTALGPGVAERADVRDVEQLVEALHDKDQVATTEEVSGNGLNGFVLVVEDNRDMSRFITRSLAASGFRVAAAFDGREGYEKAIGQRPDLVLTDIMMPEMTGDDLVRSLRQRAELSSTPIVVLTARADKGLCVRLLHEGVQDYLEKPFSAAELLARVQNLVARKRADDHVGRLRQQLEDIARAAKSISEAVAGLPEASVRQVLEILVASAQRMTSAEFVAAGIIGDPNRPFETWVSAGMPADLARKLGSPPRPVGLLGLVPKENRVIRVPDLRKLPEHRGFPPDHPVMTSFLGVPIRREGRAIGNLYLANKRGEAEFTEHDQRLVEMLVDRAGVILETAQLYAAEGVKRAWLQTVIDQIPEGIVLMDAQGQVTLKNHFMLSLAVAESPDRDRFGNPVMVDLQRPSGERLSADDLPIVQAIVHKATVQGSEFVARRADGRLVPVLVSAAPIRDTHGEPAGATMVFQDVSTLKDLERLREEWASIVAHDLQQPIAFIVMRSDMLLGEQNLTSGQKEAVRKIRNAARGLGRMVNDLTDASLLDASRMRVTFDRLDIGQLVRDVVERVPDAAPRTEIRAPVNSQLFVKGDAQRLEQVVTNLLSNAVKYGAPESRIWTRGQGRRWRCLRSLVTNRGPGIPADELPFLFERYVRSRGARTSTTKGTGLGLYIAKGLVEAHGGRIWVESTPGETTTFHFTVPLHGSPMPADWPDVADQSPSGRDVRERHS